ncbi:protein kinase [Rhizoctonia solani]|uniref:Protein kinase n=1 Tax=Rhizoctonia solani TaxID=456999 RepID=A0A8H7I634_9AGAM|nr:protein kinase [Rhizoctonia solani]
MVSPWIPNGNLSAYLRDNQCSDTDRITSCEQIRAGVAYMHSGDMIHGDLKGANVMASTRRIAMITDFGNTILKDLARSFAPTTTFGITYQYAPPEHLVARSIPIATKQSDVYSYAMTVFVRNIMPGAAGMPCEMLTYHPGDPFGKVPFEGENPSWIMIQAAQGRMPYPQQPSNISDTICRWAYDRTEPGERPDMQGINYREQDTPLDYSEMIINGVRMPSWILDALATVRQRYANDRIDIILKAWPSFGEEAPAFRLKCLDCPGMLYNLGPGQTLSNFRFT